MRKALTLARKGLGRTSPNPMVGAVIVRRGEVIASGYHKRAGDKHAEVDAFEKIRGKARKEDTLYVTLEPCNHYGRTPPCTEVILKSGLKRVVMGMRDPNPKVTGGGFELLKRKGIAVESGILESECRQLNESYIKFITTERPFVIAKSAMTLDGWTATSTGHSRWVTNERSRRIVHALRDMVDGIMVGIGTIQTDDPSLTTRLKIRKAKDPIRIIADTHLRISPEARVLNQDSPSMTLVAVRDDIPPERLSRVEKENVSTIPCPTIHGKLDLTALMAILGRMSITSLLVEGGSRIMGAMIRDRLIDKCYIFKAPKILGGDDGVPMAAGRGPKRMDDCLHLKDITVKRLGDDILIIGYPNYGGLQSPLSASRT